MVQGLLHFLSLHSVHSLSLCSILNMLKKKEKVLIRQKSPGQVLDMKSSIVCVISLRHSCRERRKFKFLYRQASSLLIGIAVVNSYLPRQKTNQMLDDLE